MYVFKHELAHAKRKCRDSSHVLEFSISTYRTKSTNFTTIQLLLLFFVIVESLN